MLLDGLLDSWRLAAGTLTALPWGTPGAVTRRTAAGAMLLAPLAVLPLAVGVVLIGLAARELAVSATVAALLAVGLLALGTRVLHWDGLSDVADGLTASYDPERSLAVMKGGTSGPAGVVATVLVAGLQVAGLAHLVTDLRGCLVAGLCVCLSRIALPSGCVRGLAPARPDGLGVDFVGTVPGWTVALWWLIAGVAAFGLGGVRAVVAVAVALVVIALLVAHTHRRFRGLTGDVLGAAVEVAFAALVVVAG